MERIGLGPWDGARDGWRASLPLTDDADAIEVDASRLRFATPTFLIRLRSFIDWHIAAGHHVCVTRPQNHHVANYMARMRVGVGLPVDVVDLPKVREHDASEVLVPVTQLRYATDVETFNEEVSPVIRAHVTDVAVLDAALSMAIAELCGNAVEHGANPHGCYVAVQRYPALRKTVLAIGDLGCGIPQSIRACFTDIGSDPAALEHALEEGVTTTGESSRGQGFYWVMDAARHSYIRYAALDVRAGRGRVCRNLDRQGRLTTLSETASERIGTWVTFEMGPKA